MSTITDVAKLARVSISTVSRVLNDSASVRPELRERVLNASEQLDYQPNTLARSLRRNESATIGMLIPDSTNPFFAEIAKGVEAYCYQHGYNAIMCNTAEDADRAEAYLDSLSQQRVAGFIVVTPPKLEQRLRRFCEQGYPLVIVDRFIPELEADSVVSDNYSGARQATHYLVLLGHERIGFISPKSDLEIVKARWAGIKDELATTGLSVDPALVYKQPDNLPHSGYAGARNLLSLRYPPTAIFAFNDLLALGVLHYAHEQGIVVPNDLSVIGFDDIDIAQYAVPSLTTISQPKYELGRKAAEVLLQGIQEGKTGFVHHVLPAELVVRRSTAAPRTPSSA